ncbi:AraC family transcriptional regulator [Spirosoma sp. KNUC1025]|uniref:helix-turn-helix domain-containing protein n=1 Tax=Spirosoma sp. KNUC1025 TaxID=2894082 RepID=UPI003864945D|nr:helix-turn-helix domain-containing protein [Spirosoma sp. KNUC1025]
MDQEESRAQAGKAKLAAYALLNQLKQQFGINSPANSGLFSIEHASLTGVADQYSITSNLDVLLLRFHLTQGFSFTISPPDASLFVLFVSVHQSITTTRVIYQLTEITVAGPSADLSTPPTGNLFILIVSRSWVSAYLPDWMALRAVDIFNDLKESIEANPSLLEIIKTDVGEFWKIYPSRPLKQLFVSVSINALLLRLLERVVYHHKHDLSHNKYLKPDLYQVEMAQQHLLTHLHDPFLTPVTLAKMANMSLTKFNRLFKELYQIPAHTFIRHYRLRIARELVDTHLYDLSQVATKVGLSSVAALTKLLAE